MQDFIVGPFDKIIETSNLPVLAGIVGLAYDGGTPFQAEVYFINLAQIIQVKFGIPFFDVYDPRFEDFGVPVAVRGTISFKIKDYKEFIKLHRLNSFNLDDFNKQINDAVTRYTKDIVSNAPASSNIPLVQIETKISLINDQVEIFVKERLKDDFGVDVTGIDIAAIEVDKTSDGYKELMSVTKNFAGAVKKAETEAQIKDIEGNQRIEMENKEELLRIQREENQYAIHKKTQSDNMGAFGVEKQAEVGIAGANALGKMGENGAGNIDISGGNGSGINMAAMMASMAVGGAVGQNIAGSMNNIMSGSNNQNKSIDTPPNIPTNEYYVAVNGNATGPFDIEKLKNMISAGELLPSSLLWKKGMPEWIRADSVEDLKNLFMPPIPPNN